MTLASFVVSRIWPLAAVLVGVLIHLATPAVSIGASQPVAVACGTSYHRWHDNVALVGAISGSPDLAQGLEAMLRMATDNRGLVGLDKTRPWAVIVLARGPIVGVYACLPIDRFDELIEVIRPWAEDVRRQGDTHRIVLPGDHVFYAAQRDRWVVVALDTETLARAAADPLLLVGDLPQQYDLAARLDVSRLSPTMRALILAGIDGATSAARSASDDQNPDNPAGQLLNRFAVRAARMALEDLDRVTLGVTVDHASRRLSAELLLAAREGTATSRRWRQFPRESAPFAGLALADATLAARWTGELSPAATGAIASWLDTAQARTLNRIEQRPAPVEHTNQAKQAAVELFDAARLLLADQQLEICGSLVLQSDAMTWISAVRYPADPEFRRKVDRLVSVARRSPQTWARVQRTADLQGVVRMLVLSRFLQGDLNDNPWIGLVGRRLEIAIGFGQSHLYLAVGRNAAEALERALAESRVAAAPQAAPIECSVALRSLTAAVGQRIEGPRKADFARIARALEPQAGKDHIRLTACPTPQGIRVRIELDEGVLAVAGLAAGLLSEPASVE
ncbi:MAG: hypothetical protein JW719_07980 [Pirellulales bacterium]|nr:hypothetical protein [Pirellulales bacterium]